METDLRMRVFAGPNGSGKSTIINEVSNFKTHKGKLLDFGYYINSDDIAVALTKNKFSFDQFGINFLEDEFIEVVHQSGLLGQVFSAEAFLASFKTNGNKLTLQVSQSNERLAQIIADFLRKKLLAEKKKFSFETVFSHPSKLDIMRQAKEAGYKVYLYFVSTESPEINKGRVFSRKRMGGHDVPVDKIESRYYRSLELLQPASDLSYQVYFFDNSENDSPFKLIAHFKMNGEQKVWDEMPTIQIPYWFKKYYLKKQENNNNTLPLA